jgi:transposase
VTLQLLWEEHRAVHPDGYGYRHYCELYRAWAVRLAPTMRQSHVAGERMFVDYGQRDARGDRSIERRGEGGAVIRRRARRAELHLC